MKILFNSYNTTAAGTSNVTKFILTALVTNGVDVGNKTLYFIVPRIDLFRDLKGTDRVKIIKLPVCSGLINFFFRGIYDILLLPLFSLVLRSKAVVVMANYAPVCLHGRKIVFMRHPYLVNEADRTGGIQKFFNIEAIRRCIFRLTLLSSDLIIVQSDYMKRRLLERFGKVAEVHILPNPVSNLLKIEPPVGEKETGSARIVLYISRFYPHKAHGFLLQLVDKYQRQLRHASVKFFVTVAPSSKGARAFLSQLREKKITDIIENIGEVSNEELAAYYKSARCVFFPSRFETFGNPLIEAMAFKLPAVVPDLGYAHAVCGNSGVYFQPDNIDDAYQKLMPLLLDDDAHKRFSFKSGRQLLNFPSVEDWLKQLFALVKTG